MNFLSLWLGICLLTTALGYKMYQDRIPNGDKVPHPCKANYVWKGVGHENELGGGVRNPFGRDFEANGKKWDECLCKRDSDGDGKTNGQELGDPDCNWEPGTSPYTTVGLSHPGVCEPFDSDSCKDRNTFDIDCSLEQFDCPELKATEDVRNTTIKIDSTQVPAEVTTYICQFVDLGVPHDQDFHMIASEPYIDNEHVMHHMILYGCPEEDLETARTKFANPTICGMEAFLCSTMISLWAVGSAGACLAPEFGIRLGENGFKYGLIEMHWNNPNEVDSYWDGSGMTLHYTPILREFDGSTFFSGPVYLELPPGYKEVTSSGFCPGQCTSGMFAETVYISSIVPHMHYRGSEMVVELIKPDGRVIPMLHEKEYNYDDPQSYVFRPATAVEPGDALQVMCTFDTSQANGFTRFGEATQDEMCLAMVQYYPFQANHSNCLTNEDGTLGFCGKFFSGEDIDLSCISSYMNLINVTVTNFWTYWYPRMRASCDVTGTQCWESCRLVFTELAEEHECLTEPNLELFKLFISRMSTSLPPELFGILASCTESDRDDWVHVDDVIDTSEGMDDSPSALCVGPTSRGANIQLSMVVIVNAMAIIGLLY